MGQGPIPCWQRACRRLADRTQLVGSHHGLQAELPPDPLPARLAHGGSTVRVALANARQRPWRRHRRRHDGCRSGLRSPDRHCRRHLVATTGKPLAMASRMVLEMPSATDGSTKACRPRMTSGTSLRSPAARPDRQPCIAQHGLHLGAQRALAHHHQAQARLAALGASCRARHKGLGQRVWSLTVCMRPTVPTSQCRGDRMGNPQSGTGPCGAGLEAVGVDAVVDLGDCPGPARAPWSQIAARSRDKRNVVVHKRLVGRRIRW
jgi:hypothetical protein